MSETYKKYLYLVDTFVGYNALKEMLLKDKELFQLLPKQQIEVQFNELNKFKKTIYLLYNNNLMFKSIFATMFPDIGFGQRYLFSGNSVQLDYAIEESFRNVEIEIQSHTGDSGKLVISINSFCPTIVAIPKETSHRQSLSTDEMFDLLNKTSDDLKKINNILYNGRLEKKAMLILLKELFKSNLKINGVIEKPNNFKIIYNPPLEFIITMNKKEDYILLKKVLELVVNLKKHKCLLETIPRLRVKEFDSFCFDKASRTFVGTDEYYLKDIHERKKLPFYIFSKSEKIENKFVSYLEFWFVKYIKDEYPTYLAFKFIFNNKKLKNTKFCKDLLCSNYTDALKEYNVFLKKVR